MQVEPGAASAHPHVPVIDIAALRDGDMAQRRAVAAALRAACLDRGFFYIRNHGVPRRLVDQVFDRAKAFFGQPEADKLAVDKAKSGCHRGYEPLRAQVLESGAPPDLKESFYAGVDLPPDDPRVVAGKFAHGPNQWPAQVADFQSVMEAYFKEMLALVKVLMRGIALSLDLPERYFEPFENEAVATLRLLHYPPQPAHPLPDEKGCGAHTDFGSLTLLAQDDVGGLQVWTEDAGWIAAPPLPDTYVVNLGDLVARWTNDRYRSTLHRVINASGVERYSVPFFFTGNPDYVVSCLPGCADADGTGRYPPVTTLRHLEECYVRTYGIGR